MSLGAIRQTIAFTLYNLGNEMSLACGWLPRTWGKYIVTGAMFMARYYEPEHVEDVEHDTVMILVDGKLVEVTADDAEVRK